MTWHYLKLLQDEILDFKHGTVHLRPCWEWSACIMKVNTYVLVENDLHVLWRWTLTSLLRMICTYYESEHLLPCWEWSARIMKVNTYVLVENDLHVLWKWTLTSLLRMICMYYESEHLRPCWEWSACWSPPPVQWCWRDSGQGGRSLLLQICAMSEM